MSSSSSTSSSDSSSEFSELERAPRRRVPWAALALLGTVVVVETFLGQSRQWFSDRAAWQWQIKDELVREGALEGDVALVGTSVLFHAVDARRASELTGPGRRVVNLALNGARLPQQAHIVERYLATGAKPRWVVLELRDVETPERSWLAGPYWRFWAHYGEFLRSERLHEEPSLLFAFASNRLLRSFAYRESLDNFIFTCARERGLHRDTHDRNAAITVEMRARRGFSSGTFDEGLEEAEVPGPQERPWKTSAVGETWLDRLLATCRDAGVRVAIVLPASPPHVEADRERSGFRDDFERFLESLRRAYPELGLPLFAPCGYETADFADNAHFSQTGSERFTDDLGRWIATLDAK